MILWWWQDLQFWDLCPHQASPSVLASTTTSMLPLHPAKYRESQDVFKKGADLLTASIEMVLARPVPVRHLYTLSESDLAVLQGFLDKNLHWGFIHCSTSPISAPMFCEKQKWGSQNLYDNYNYIIPGLICISGWTKDNTKYTILPVPVTSNLETPGVGERRLNLYWSRPLGHLQSGVHLGGLWMENQFQHKV